MTRLPTLSAALLAAATIALAGCDRGAPPGGAANAANGASPAASQTMSSQTLGTSPPPNDGTLPRGTTGSTGSRRGGGKS